MEYEIAALEYYIDDSDDIILEREEKLTLKDDEIEQ